MCGIVAALGSADPSLIDRLNATQTHRGPNDSGLREFPDLDVTIAMRRLSILDLSGGHQPMGSANGEAWIVFNGEIFNSPEIRQRLVASGRRFVTENSDTEVLLHLYEEKGEGMLDELNGMFSFVIVDRKRRRVFGARDRFGIKPLYYASCGGALFLASELKTLISVPGFQPEVNRQSLFHYLTLGYVPGEKSILEGIHRVPPAHSFSWQPGGTELSLRRYWSPRMDARRGMSDEDAAELLRHSLGEAVARWSLSDVPVACSLSGGLDSSLVTALYSMKTGRKIRTYSLGFAEKHAEDINELPLARLVAQKFSTDHHELVLRSSDVTRELIPMAWHLDEPYGGGLPSWYVFQFMAKDVRVGLTGTGGDEIFGDYGKWVGMDSFPMSAWTRKWMRGDESGWTGLFNGGVSPVRSRYMPYSYYLSDEEKRRSAFVNPEGLRDTASYFESIFRSAPTNDVRDACSWVDMGSQLPDEFLLMTDRFSMAHSLEARVPFLDHEFVESMFSIPSDVRSSKGDLKRLLRRASAGILPDEIVRGGKRGFVLPTAAWLRGELRPLAETLLAPDRLRRQGYLDADYYGRLLREHQSGVDHHKKIWFALMFELWHFIFIEQSARARPTFELSDIRGDL